MPIFFITFFYNSKDKSFNDSSFIGKKEFLLMSDYHKNENNLFDKSQEFLENLAIFSYPFLKKDKQLNKNLNELKIISQFNKIKKNEELINSQEFYVLEIALSENFRNFENMKELYKTVSNETMKKQNYSLVVREKFSLNSIKYSYKYEIKKKKWNIFIHVKFGYM